MQTSTLLKPLLWLLSLFGFNRNNNNVQQGEVPPLIDRLEAFGGTKYENVKLSPNGQYISYTFNSNIWLVQTASLSGVDVETPPGRKVLQPQDEGSIHEYHFAFDNQHILYSRDNDGNEDFQLFKVNIQTGQSERFTPPNNVRAYFYAFSSALPEQMVFGMNDRDPYNPDPYLYDLTTGRRRMLVQNDRFGSFLRLPTFVFDHALQLRLAHENERSQGAVTYFSRSSNRWIPYRYVAPNDSMITRPLKFDKSGEKLYWIDSAGRDKAALTEMDFASKTTQVLFAPIRADVQDVIFDSRTDTPAMVVVNYDRERLISVDSDTAQDLAYLRTVSPGELQFVGSNVDFSVWLVSFINDTVPIKYYLYDRNTRRASYVFQESKTTSYNTVPLHVLEVETRDGLNELCYYSIPSESDPQNTKIPEQPLPTVLYVHGGPNLRENWGFDDKPQFFTNRGFAFLNCNFRGSTNFGKRYFNAAAREWGRKMQYDLIDAVERAAQMGIVDRSKVAIFGGSYGGYSALAGLTFTPDAFACGVDMFGPSNITSTIEDAPPNELHRAGFNNKSIGDITTAEGRAFLASRSPLNFANRIKKPLLVAQGANDPKVTQKESDQIVAAAKQNGVPVTYILFTDEGHGFHGMNMIAFTAVAENFLQKCLGGRAEPIGDLCQSSIQVIEGGLLQAELQKYMRGRRQC